MTMRARLSRLEAASPLDEFRPYHRVVADSNKECEEKRRELIKSGRAAETDNFIFRVIVRSLQRQH